MLQNKECINCKGAPYQSKHGREELLALKPVLLWITFQYVGRSWSRNQFRCLQLLNTFLQYKCALIYIGEGRISIINLTFCDQMSLCEQEMAFMLTNRRSETFATKISHSQGLGCQRGNRRSISRNYCFTAQYSIVWELHNNIPPRKAYVDCHVA